jgi:hypothetical protein
MNENRTMRLDETILRRETGRIKEKEGINLTRIYCKL